MVKRKERIITELYTGTVKINELEVSSQADKGIFRHTTGQHINMRVDPGTCNVCSAPCSSCLHVNQTRIESKIGESLDETSRESAFSYSVDDRVRTKDSRGCEISQHTTSETSNMISVNSNFDCFIENAESKASPKISVISGASQDVEGSNKLLSGGSVREKPYTPNSHKKDADNSNSIGEFEDLRGLEGHDDNISCISGDNEASKMHNSNKGTADTNGLTKCAASPSSLASEENIKADQSQAASFLDKHELEGVPNKFGGEIVSKTVSGQKSASYASGDIQDNKIGHVGGNSEPIAVECPKVEAESDSDDLPTEALNSVEKKKEVVKASELIALPDARETFVHSDPVNESDESDIVEHDVKVCDICGDAGREDLLAVCCSCSEGAEHTYCMQKMLDKIPEGDWLCQDCKSEERKAQEKVKCKLVDGDGPDGIYRMPGHVDSKNAKMGGKRDRLDTYVDSIKAEKDGSHVKLSRKRKAENAEVSSAAKRQVIEPKIRSPKTSSPRRVDVLSRDISFKNLDRGKVSPAHQIPTGVQTSNSASEVACPSLDARIHTSRGTFLKSKSFSSASAKHKIKLVDEVVPQKQKSNREATSLDTKGGLNRTMGKSMSFTSVNSGRLNSTDSKVQMLFPKFSHAQDIKGQKQTKERSLVERKNSVRLERPLVTSTVASSTTSSSRVDKNVAVRDEAVPFSSTSNNRELKAVRSDNKLTQLSRPVNKVSCKGSEVSVPSGEGTRQLSSASGICNSVEKSIQARTKDDCSSTSLSTERPISKISGSIPDGLTQARESMNVVENVKEISDSHPKQSTTAGGKVFPCQKCKGAGHSAEYCTIDSPEQSFAPDVHTSRSSKQFIHKDNRLKAAIEAAMLKKPGIYRKNRVQDQSDELTVSCIKSEVCSQDQLSNTCNPRKLVSGEEVSKELASAWNPNAEFSKQTTGTNVKQFTNSAEAGTASSHRPISPADGKSITMDLPSNAPVSISDLSIMSAIPEHEYIWQGCFEVRRSGKLPDCYDGFQAHLSACASPRVLETMNKFPNTVLLNEVPRRSVWPIQFEETGVNEDHIALYFFARDYESYEKSYKSILENMMRKDLALKGNIDGVEILIFPSNQLPIKYQRWNMMFFIWGVFRGKRNSCVQQVPGSPQKIASSRGMPTDIMTSTENICSLLPVDKDFPACNKARKVVSDVNSLIDLQCLPSTKTMNGDSDSKSVSHFQQNDCVNSAKEQKGYRFDCNSVPTNQTKPPQSWQDTRCRPTSLGQVDQDFKVIKEPQASVQVVSSASGSNTSHEQKTGHLSTPYDMHPSPQIHSKFSAGVQDLTFIGSVGEVNNKEQLRPRNMKIEGLLGAEAVAERGTVRFSMPRELNSWPLSYRKQSMFDSPVLKSEPAFAGSSQAVQGNDRNNIFDNGGIVNKKQKLDYSDLYGLTDLTRSSRDGSVIQDSASSFPVKRKYNEDSTETPISRTPGNAERYFFPVDPYNVKHVDLGDNSILRKRALPEDEEPLEDMIPNLELALGAETKPPLKQSLPHFLAAQIEKNNQDQPLGRTVITAEEDASAALSLSLSFSFADKEQSRQPVATKELLPLGRQQEFNFFGGFSDK